MQIDISDLMTDENLNELGRYVQGLFHIEDATLEFLNFLSDIFSLDAFSQDRHVIVYDYLYRGISTDYPITDPAEHIRNMQWCSWSLDRDIAIDIALKGKKKYHYLLTKKGLGIDLSKVHSLYPGIGTKFETYEPNKELEVLSDCYYKEYIIEDLNNY